MTSYLSENEAKNLQNGDVHVAQIPDFKMGAVSNSEKESMWVKTQLSSCVKVVHLHAPIT